MFKFNWIIFFFTYFFRCKFFSFLMNFLFTCELFIYIFLYFFFEFFIFYFWDFHLFYYYYSVFITSNKLFRVPFWDLINFLQNFFFFFWVNNYIYIYIYNKWVDSGLPTLCFFFFDKQLSSVILSTIFSQLIWAYHSHHFFLFNNILYLNFIQYIR